MFAKQLTQQLGKPTKGITGWLVKKFLENKNSFLEENAVELCNILPDNIVLELFGPGVGLSEAVKYLTGPKGKLYGIDVSEYMYEVSRKRLQDHIQTGKVILFHGSAENIPLCESKVDKVYHCNCYYFWPNLRAVSTEIHRVMKPAGGLMVTTINVESVKKAVSKGILKGKTWQPELYMEALKDTGFGDVRMEEREDTGRNFQAIFATAIK
uniref:Zgc:194242 n=1 Tax=Latimeria chalumnae TaxID=7897 RepID=H3AD94_LATCH